MAENDPPPVCLNLSTSQDKTACYILFSQTVNLQFIGGEGHHGLLNGLLNVAFFVLPMWFLASKEDGLKDKFPFEGNQSFESGSLAMLSAHCCQFCTCCKPDRGLGCVCVSLGSQLPPPGPFYKSQMNRHMHTQIV